MIVDDWQDKQELLSLWCVVLKVIYTATKFDCHCNVKNVEGAVIGCTTKVVTRI